MLLVANRMDVFGLVRAMSQGVMRVMLMLLFRGGLIVQDSYLVGP